MSKQRRSIPAEYEWLCLSQAGMERVLRPPPSDVRPLCVSVVGAVLAMCDLSIPFVYQDIVGVCGLTAKIVQGCQQPLNDPMLPAMAVVRLGCALASFGEHEDFPLVAESLRVLCNCRARRVALTARLVADTLIGAFADKAGVIADAVETMHPPVDWYKDFRPM